jgi:hypothetical protein
MRAFRPSHFSQEGDYSEDADRAKQDNLRLYAKRAAAGMPLFSPTPAVRDAQAGSDYAASA